MVVVVDVVVVVSVADELSRLTNSGAGGSADPLAGWAEEPPLSVAPSVPSTVEIS